jgi:hypothetical protein
LPAGAFFGFTDVADFEVKFDESFISRVRDVLRLLRTQRTDLLEEALEARWSNDVHELTGGSG